MGIQRGILRHSAVGVIAIAAAAGISFAIPPTPLQAQQGTIPSAQAEGTPAAATLNSKTSEEEHVHSDSTHQYSSQADRANDAMLITAVKSALASDGITSGHAVVVDCDHGTVTLSGALGSAADAQHAVQVASAVDGVRHVNSKLTW